MSLPTSITVTLTDMKAIAGLNAAAKATNTDINTFAMSVLTGEGYKYRDQYQADAVTSSAFIARFTQAEYAAVLADAGTDPNVAAFVAQLNAAPYVWLQSDAVDQAMAYMVAKGYVTQARATAILAY